MGRLLRWTLNLAAIVSAPLFVAACALWVRSYQRIDGVRKWDVQGYTEFFSYRGGFWVGRIDCGPGEGTILESLSDEEGNLRASQTFLIFGDCRNRAGFASSSARGIEGGSRMTIRAFPLPLILLPLLAFPMLRVGCSPFILGAPSVPVLPVPR